jgi:hypothetical protein
MRKITTKSPQTFAYFMKKYAPDFVAVDKSEPNDADDRNRYYRSKNTSELFKAWFFFDWQAGHQDTCSLVLEEPTMIDVSSKKELLDQLKKLGVSPEDLEKLQKMGVKKMVALTMISRSEDEEETTTIEKTEKSNLEFKVGLRCK